MQDIFSEEALDELATLQSSLPTFNDNDAMRLIEGEMRAEIGEPNQTRSGIRSRCAVSPLGAYRHTAPGVV